VTDPLRIVTQYYHDLLGRGLDPSGQATWVGGLQNGTLTTTQVVLGIENSVEFRTLVIQGQFNQLLHRTPDPVGLQALLGFTAVQGTTAAQLEALILGSPEFFINSGGTNLGFLQAVYQDVLGRAIDPAGQAFWLSELTRRGSSGDNTDDDRKARTAVAALIVNSLESDMRQVQGLYSRFLSRAADTGGLNAFTNALASGVPLDQLVAVMLTSPEYLSRVR
jgi:hypothetical protein